jgi:hypothetical protein
MSLNHSDIALIAERLDVFVSTGDVDSVRAEDVLALLDEVRILTRQHNHDVKMLTRCREQLGKVADDYREAIAHLTALDAQAAADGPHRGEALDAQAAAEVEAP